MTDLSRRRSSDDGSGARTAAIPRVTAVEAEALASFSAWREARGVIDQDGPVETMARILREADEWYRFLSEILDGIRVEDWESKGKDGAVQLTVYVSLFERAQERAFKIAAEFTKLGLAERLAAVSVQQGEAIIAVLIGVVDDLDLGAEKRALALESAGRHLAVLAGGLPDPEQPARQPRGPANR